MLCSFHRRNESEINLNKRLKVSYVRNSGWKHPVSYKHKETKGTVKNFGFFSIITKNAKLKYP